MTKWRAETVFCDDIRQEITGKHILIGVYGADLVPGILPATFPIGMWIRFSGLQVGRHKFEMRLLDPTGRQAGTLNGETDVMSDDAPTVFALSGLPVELKEPGNIVVQFAFDGGDPIEIGRLKVSRPLATDPPIQTQSIRR